MVLECSQTVLATPVLHDEVIQEIIHKVIIFKPAHSSVAGGCHAHDQCEPHVIGLQFG